MPVCPNCGVAFLDGETHTHAPAAGAFQKFLMVCGAIFIGLIVLLIGLCGGIR